MLPQRVALLASILAALAAVVLVNLAVTTLWGWPWAELVDGLAAVYVAYVLSTFGEKGGGA